MPRVGELVGRFKARVLEGHESRALAEQAVLLRYPALDLAPIDAETLLEARRPEDQGVDLWNTTNRLQENLIRGGVSDSRRDRRGRLRTVRALRGIDSKVAVNKGLWGLAERLANGEALVPAEGLTITA